MRWLACLLALTAALQRPQSTSELMAKTIYPASDAIFYIETRTPANDGDWRALQAHIDRLAAAARSLTDARYARDRERWAADAKLLVDVSEKAAVAAKAKDVSALAALNDDLYQSCVTCHQHYRPNYGRAAAAMPDLQGVWSFATLTPLERPAEFADKEFITEAEAAAWVNQNLERNNRDRRDGGADVDVGRAVNDYWFERGTSLASVGGKIRTSLVTDPPDGRVPAATPEARAKAAARNADARQHPADGPENRSLQERCLSFNAGPPMLPGPYNNYVEIFQFPTHVVIYTEMIHDARIVPLDGRSHVPLSVRKWLGDSVGRWEGDTLVVDTTNFTDKTNIRGSDENLHLVERFSRPDANTLLYEFTVDDPTVFVRPWSAALPMTRADVRLFEYACHEGNYALEDILRGARYQEKLRK